MIRTIRSLPSTYVSVSLLVTSSEDEGHDVIGDVCLFVCLFLFIPVKWITQKLLKHFH